MAKLNVQSDGLKGGTNLGLMWLSIAGVVEKNHTNRHFINKKKISVVHAIVCLFIFFLKEKMQN